MRIDSSDMAMASKRTFQARHSVLERLQQWQGRAPAATTPAQPTQPAVPKTDTAELSEKGKSLLQPDVKQQKVLDLLQRMFGISEVTSLDLSIDVSHAQGVTAQMTESSAQSGSGMSYDYQESYAEFEQTSLSAQGTITLADGRSFTLDLQWQQTRTYVEQHSLSIRAGDAALVDPVALDLTGQGLRFLDKKMPFDLDGDGKQDHVGRLAANARWLALDRNGNGKVDDGSELFGPRSGDGFGELAQLDGDGNGWLDAGDDIFAKLSLWDGANPPALLTSFGIGALSTGAIEAHFRHTDADNHLLALARKAGLFLRDDGSAGVSSQVDLVA